MLTKMKMASAASTHGGVGVPHYLHSAYFLCTPQLDNCVGLGVGEFQGLSTSSVATMSQEFCISVMAKFL